MLFLFAAVLKGNSTTAFKGDGDGRGVTSFI